MTVNYAGEALWTDVLGAEFHGYTDAYTMLNATMGYRFAEGRATLLLKGTNLTNDDDHAARLRRHPQEVDRGGAAVLRALIRGGRGPQGVARGLSIGGEGAYPNHCRASSRRSRGLVNSAG